MSAQCAAVYRAYSSETRGGLGRARGQVAWTPLATTAPSLSPPVGGGGSAAARMGTGRGKRGLALGTKSRERQNTVTKMNKTLTQYLENRIGKLGPLGLAWFVNGVRPWVQAVTSPSAASSAGTVLRCRGLAEPAPRSASPLGDLSAAGGGPGVPQRTRLAGRRTARSSPGPRPHTAHRGRIHAEHLKRGFRPGCSEPLRSE